jgi:hypothetical protein
MIKGTKAYLQKMSKKNNYGDQLILTKTTSNLWHTDNLQLMCVSLPERKSLGAYLYFKKYKTDIIKFLDVISKFDFLSLPNGSILTKDEIKVDDKGWDDITISYIKYNGDIASDDLDLFRNGIIELIVMSGINI